MTTRVLAVALLAFVSCRCIQSFGQVGQPLPEAKVEDFGSTEAKTMEDFTGRLLLLEFFAYT